MSNTTVRLSSGLATNGYAVGNINTELGYDLTGSPEWRVFAGGWDRLPIDTFMADGGTYRLRRFSLYRCDSVTDEVTLLPRRPFSQPVEINYLNGGVDRDFEPLEETTSSSPVLRQILTWCVDVFSELQGPSVWQAQCFQNRTLARPGIPGKPTPEGVHRDGADYNVIVMGRRAGVDGGANTIYSADTREPIVETLLSEPGDFLLNDDRRTLHSATSVTQSGAAEGHRDVFIVSFIRIQNDAATG